MEQTLSAIAGAFEVLGSGAMVAGFILAVLYAIRSLLRHEGGEKAFTVLRSTLGGGILLGLEILVAADLFRTITSAPSLEDTLILGLIVVIRTVLSMSISIEIEGVLPWKRALLTSGAQHIAAATKADAAAARAVKVNPDPAG